MSGVQSLGELGDKLRLLGERARVHTVPARNVREYAKAPTLTEWAQHEGLDLLKLTTRGGVSEHKLERDYARELERILSNAFWDSNNTVNYGFPVQEPGPEFGADEPPADEAPSSLTKYLQQNKPATFGDLAAVMKATANKVQRLGVRPTDSYEPPTRRTKEGRRAAGEAPTLAQWAKKAGIKLQWMSKTAVDEAERVFKRLLEQQLTTLFWPASGRGAAAAQPAKDSLTADVLGAKMRGASNEAATLGIGDSIQQWCRGRFIDYDERALQEFRRYFPSIKLRELVHVASTTWEKAADGKFINFSRFLKRVAAYHAIRKIKPEWDDTLLHNYIHEDLNDIYQVLNNACQLLTGERLNGFLLPQKLPTMPLMMDTDPQSVIAYVDDIVARNTGQRTSMTPDGFLKELAKRVQVGRGPQNRDLPLDKLVEAVVRDAGADLAEAAKPAETRRKFVEASQNPYVAPRGVYDHSDVLYALKAAPFGLKSTADMVHAAARAGLEPYDPIGTGWVTQSGVGGGQFRRTAVQDAEKNVIRQLLTAIVANNGLGGLGGGGDRPLTHDEQTLRVPSKYLPLAASDTTKKHRPRQSVYHEPRYRRRRDDYYDDRRRRRDDYYDDRYAPRR